MAMTPERERTVTVLSIVLTLIALGAYFTFSNSPLSLRIRALVGVDDRLAPKVESDTTGPYAFLNTGSDGEPVGFSPCQKIRYVVNPQYAPEGWEGFVDEAVTEVEERTGLVFADDGTTTDRTFDDRMRGQDPQPVLIGWADEDEVGVLADDVAGVGGPTMVSLGRLKAYVTGSVVLDRDVTDRLTQQRDGERLQVALLLHELGHLVGLDHVDDQGEIMYPQGLTRLDYGPGDREGLALLGDVPCA